MPPPPSSSNNSGCDHGHESINLTQGDFKSFEFESDWEKRARFYCMIPRHKLNSLRTDAVLNWGNVSSLRSFIENTLLLDILGTLELPEMLTAFSELNFDKFHRPHVIVIRWRNIPICVIQVKNRISVQIMMQIHGAPFLKMMSPSKN